jgi:hypothetical protein
MQSTPQRTRCRWSVMMVRCCDHDGIQVDLIQQQAIVGIRLRIGVSRRRRTERILIDIA